MQKKLLTQVSMAHLVSHLHMMTVPAMLPLLPKAMNVSFMQLGLAIGLFNIISALVQAPLGFMVDRIGAHRMLACALAVGAASFALLAIWPTFFVLLLAMTFAGIANGVYHPADYALLSRGMQPERMGKAFSIHTFAGFLGAAIAPPVLLGLTHSVGASWAFAFSSVASLLVLGWMLFNMHVFTALIEPAPERKDTADKRPLRIPVMTLFGFAFLFMLLSLSTGAIEKFSVSALVQGFSIPLLVANQGLTAFLLMSALGVLFGGYLADRTTKHGMVAASAFALAALCVLLIVTVQLPSLILILVMGVIGVLTGMVAPSRDMLVRAASPRGAEGRVFGIVSTGFNVGGVIGPIFLGYLLDQQLAVAVLWAAIVFMVSTSLVVVLQELKQRN